MDPVAPATSLNCEGKLEKKVIIETYFVFALHFVFIFQRLFRLLLKTWLRNKCPFDNYGMWVSCQIHALVFTIAQGHSDSDNKGNRCKVDATYNDAVLSC